MHPVLFEIGSVSVSSYSATLLAAFIVSYILSGPEFKRTGLRDELRDYVLMACVLGGLVGAKLVFIMENATMSEFLSNPMRYFASGLTMLGGFIGAMVLITAVLWVTKQNFLHVCDVVSPLFIVSSAIGRLGCLLVGDDYGVRSSLPWAMSFPQGSPPTTLRVHPTQIYEIIMLLAVFAYLWAVRKRPAPNGQLFGLALVLMGLERFLVEFIRTTTPSFVPGISVAQLMSLGCLSVGVILIAGLRLRSRAPQEQGT